MDESDVDNSRNSFGCSAVEMQFAWKDALTVELRWNEFEMVRLVGGLGIEAKLDATWLGQQSCFESHVGLQHL